MINEIDTMIQEARKSKKQDVLLVLQAIKSEFSKVIHSGYILDEAKEMNILSKMYEDRKNSAKIYEENGRPDLAKIENMEAIQINQFLPERLPDHVVIRDVEAILNNEFPSATMKDMKTIMATVKSKYPLADNKLVAQTVKNFLKQ